jgi:hypothetical protein
LFKTILPPIKGKLVEEKKLNETVDGCALKEAALTTLEKKRLNKIPPLLVMKTNGRAKTAEEEIDQELSLMTEDEDY